MNKKVLTILITSLVAILLIGTAVLTTLSRKIPTNPQGTIGNSAGNLNNNGLFCESDGLVYFSNSNDHHYLYSMNSDGTNIKLLADVPVSYINAGGDYLYFYYDDQGDAKFMGFSGNMRGIYRLPKNGKDKPKCLSRCTSGIVNLIDNELYYQHYDNTDGMTLYHSTLDGSDKGMLIKDIINPSCVLGGNIIYPDTNNMFLLNEYIPGSTHGTHLLDERMYNPCVSDGYIYYINVDDNYRLYRYDLQNSTAYKLTNDRVDTFNVYGDVIFYQRNKEPALIKCYADGSNAITLAEGAFCNINCTSYYTYFQSFFDSTDMYRTPTFGGSEVNEFIVYPEN